MQIFAFNKRLAIIHYSSLFSHSLFNYLLCQIIVSRNNARHSLKYSDKILELLFLIWREILSEKQEWISQRSTELWTHSRCSDSSMRWLLRVRGSYFLASVLMLPSKILLRLLFVRIVEPSTISMYDSLLHTPWWRHLHESNHAKHALLDKSFFLYLDR